MQEKTRVSPGPCHAWAAIRSLFWRPLSDATLIVVACLLSSFLHIFVSVQVGQRVPCFVHPFSFTKRT